MAELAHVATGGGEPAARLSQGVVVVAGSRCIVSGGGLRRSQLATPLLGLVQVVGERQTVISWVKGRRQDLVQHREM